MGLQGGWAAPLFSPRSGPGVCWPRHARPVAITPRAGRAATPTPSQEPEAAVEPEQADRVPAPHPKQSVRMDAIAAATEYVVVCP